MLRTKSFLFALAIPFAVAFVPALASAEPPAADAQEAAPTSTVSAKFQRYVLSPGGRPMGLLLEGGTFVRTPRRALNREAPPLQVGDAVDVEGVAMKTPTGALMMHAVVRQNGNVIADASQLRGHRHHRDHQGREHRHPRAELTPVSGAGRVASLISTPRGRVMAVVLDDGTTAMAHGLGDLGLKVGDKIAVAGRGGTYTQGKALRIEKITLPDGQIRDIPPRVRVAPGETPNPV
jgi:hypothetical protein